MYLNLVIDPFYWNYIDVFVGYAPCLRANRSGLLVVKATRQQGNKDKSCRIVSQYIFAMRGRNPDNPSCRIKGSYYEQRIEINSLGISNTLTTVQKDNMVLEVWK